MLEFEGRRGGTSIDLRGGSLTRQLAEPGGPPFLLSTLHSEPALCFTAGPIAEGRHAIVSLSDPRPQWLASPEELHEALLAFSQQRAQPDQDLVGPRPDDADFVDGRALVARAASIATAVSGRRGWSRASDDEVISWVDELDLALRTRVTSVADRVYGVAAVALLLAYRVGARGLDYAPLSEERDPMPIEVPIVALSDYRSVDIIGLGRLRERARRQHAIALRDLFATSFLLLERDGLGRLPPDLLSPDEHRGYGLQGNDGPILGSTVSAPPLADPEPGLE